MAFDITTDPGRVLLRLANGSVELFPIESPIQIVEPDAPEPVEWEP